MSCHLRPREGLQLDRAGVPCGKGGFSPQVKEFDRVVRLARGVRRDQLPAAVDDSEESQAGQGIGRVPSVVLENPAQDRSPLRDGGCIEQVLAARFRRAYLILKSEITRLRAVPYGRIFSI
jgi:hypothetical protein